MYTSKLPVHLRTYVLLLLVLALSLTGTGCTNVSPRYSVSSDNALALRDLSSQTSTKIRTGQFQGEDTSESCRGGSFEPPDHETFAFFIGEAFRDEFILSNVYAKNAPIVLSGRLIDIYLDAGMGEGSWEIEMEISVTGQPPFIIKEKHFFEGGFAAITVCENARSAFVPAVQDFVAAVIAHPTFRSTFSITEKSDGE